MPIVNEEDLDAAETDRGAARFARVHLSEAASDGPDPDLGCSLYELPPGGRSWPYHYHEGNAEAMYVLEGEGALRLAGETLSIEAGDYVPFPAGESGAHRVINDSEGPLRYLAMSTMRDPDVTVYPDSGKVGVFGGAPPGGRDQRTLSGFFRREDAVDYWKGEE